jgi:hypothetical protein
MILCSGLDPAFCSCNLLNCSIEIRQAIDSIAGRWRMGAQGRGGRERGGSGNEYGRGGDGVKLKLLQMLPSLHF